ncbi:serine hydrolase domain-containing protein [Ruminococcus sp.]|uniref:serine hydrolase domain-containing protein n=1 Tax=Ruminococcus sp. TaxID=41978 RepID=UPI001B290655|nr:serine hydrolase domain-containing protein [Ruminococcus sp.]MBO5557339.1 beta-lactamase family protein [Ruminococcus sp.]
MKQIKIISAAVMTLLMLTGCGSVKADKTENTDTAAKAVSAENNTAEGEYIYCVGSVSKIYSTAAVMQLVDKGLVELDTPITEYIPDFKMADERYKDITVRMLMDHTSGLMGSTTVNSGLYDDNDTYNHDHLLENLASQRLKTAPGEYAAYCNDGFGLLELIVENVTGKSYTDYVRENISDKIGVTDTGTPIDMFRNDMLVPSFSAGGLPLETSYCVTIGDGGIYATASDTAKFGAAFFTGDDTLIPDDAKSAMSTRHNDNEYSDDNGLGWDHAEMLRYKQNGVKVVGKGGDTDMDHAFLMVAPDEKISVAVLSNGGGSTMNELAAQTLMDVCLQEKGINIAEEELPECTIADEIPDEYKSYEGWYVMCIMGEGDTLCRVTFPDNKYLHMEKITSRKTEYTDYVYTADGDFAELAYEVDESGFDKRLLAGGSSRLSFEKDADGTFMKISGGLYYPELGSIDVKMYAGQMIEENNVGEGVINSFKALDGKKFLLVGDKYSSSNYEDSSIGQFSVINELNGYVFLASEKTEYLLKITDGEHLVSPKNIPSSSSRDLMDITLYTDKNGRQTMKTSFGTEYILANDIPEFDISVKTVEMTGNAEWYSISDSIANTPVTVTRPENSAVIVFNKFDEPIYTSHVKDAGNVIPMPKGGRVLFLGEAGTKFGITA